MSKSESEIKYKEILKNEVNRIPEHDFIFIKKDGTPAEIGTIRSWMNKWDTVLNSHWYPHAGRHFWCSYLMQIGLEKSITISGISTIFFSFKSYTPTTSLLNLSLIR